MEKKAYEKMMSDVADVVRKFTQQEITRVMEPIVEEIKILQQQSPVPGPQGEKGDPGPSGVGMTDALIDQDGVLVLTFSDGKTKTLSRVVGLDGKDGKDGAPGKDGEPGPAGQRGEKGDPGAPGKDGEPGKDGVAGEKGDPGYHGQKGDPGENGRDGKDGLHGRDGRDGKDGERGEKGERGEVIIGDMNVSMAERTLIFEIKSGGVSHVAEAKVEGLVLDRGVFSENGNYEHGDGVTWAGSYWIAQKSSGLGKPGEGDSGWRLAVKRGRDGRDGK